MQWRHTAAMSRRLPELLRAHRLRLKADWSRRLGARPPRSPLALPEILQHRMNDTLDQLDDLLRTRPTLMMRKVREPEPCRCDLNPLLDYFATGGEALAAGLNGELSAAEETILDRAWHYLAAREIQALCGACLRPTGFCRAGSPDTAMTSDFVAGRFAGYPSGGAR